MSVETKLSVLVSLFEWIQRTKSSAKKRSKFRKFLDTFCNPLDYFTPIRLILPTLDRERGSYGLKESVLSTLLIDSLGMSRHSHDAQKLINWRKAGAKAGSNAGNFSLVAAEVLQRRQGMTSGGLTMKELNVALDRLASSGNRAEKISVLSDLIKNTNAQEMKWIVMIILKDLKLGISEKSIFHEFHPDAEDLFNVTCDLKLVCEKLKDRSQRHKRQDIEVGKAVRPQLARRVANAHAAWKMLRGKEVVVECKFDGDRIQIHKNGDEMHYFSRNFLDHFEYAHGMSDIIKNNVLAERCILDGEMLVWDTSQNQFAEFGSNQEIAKAAKDGFDSDRQLCYVAFDILYIGDTSVIHQSLKERHELLRKFVMPLKGRLEILVPNGGLNDHSLPGEPCWSFTAQNVNDVENFFRKTIENRDEGIILKDLGSKWEPSDRSGKWLKLKPDYVNPGSDLDVLIIGGYYGSGRHGGEVAQFLVGLADRPSANAYPNRVGTGLSDDELEVLVSKLRPYFRKYEYRKKAAPSFYHVTNNSKERPDVWIESPEKSIILSIASDIRTIRSEVFAAPYSLRFPRIDRVRYDKPWHECLDVQSFVELVHSSNGTTQNGKELGDLQGRKPKHTKSSGRGNQKNVSIVPSHFLQTDVSDVKGESFIFSNMVFYFVNVPQTHSLDVLHKMVAENGGSFSMNWNNTVTHCIAAESKGIKYQAAKLRGDVIHYSWVLDCCLQKRLLPLQPKFFLFLSDITKTKLQEENDEFSDAFFCDIDLADIKQLLGNIETPGDTGSIDYYEKQYCPKNKWSLFHGSCIYFYLSTGSKKPDCEALLEHALRRLKLEVLMAGGRVTDNLSDATHLVVLVIPGYDMDYDSLVKCFTIADKQRFRDKSLHVIRSQWLEDSLQCEQKKDELTYTLNLNGTESFIPECQDTVETNESPPSLARIKNQKLLSSSTPIVSKEKEEKDALEDLQEVYLSKRDPERKRGVPATRSKNKMRAQRQPRTKRMRLGAKIHDEESDERASDCEANEEIVMTKSDDEHKRANVTKNSELSGESLECSYGGTERKSGVTAGRKNKMRAQRQPRTKRMRLGAKIHDEESDERASDGVANEEILMTKSDDEYKRANVTINSEVSGIEEALECSYGGTERKSGVPAAGSKNKMRAQRQPRTKRIRLGAKIHDEESDERASDGVANEEILMTKSDDEDKRANATKNLEFSGIGEALEGSYVDTKRKSGVPAAWSKNKMRAQRTKWTNLGAKIHDEESDERASDGVENEEKILMNKSSDDYKRANATKNSEVSGIGEALECSYGGTKRKGEDIPRDKGVDWQASNCGDIETRECGGETMEKSEKVEVKVDPLEAMLLDMIPSLGKKRSEVVNPTNDEKGKDVDSATEPVKKKKVSYKQLAEDLLKDS